MNTLHTKDKNFFTKLKIILQKRSQQNIPNIDSVVKKIIFDVIKRGDKALIEYTKKFDGAKINKKNILLSRKLRNSYKNQIDPQTMNAFKVSIANVTKFHKKQKPKNYKLSSKGVNNKHVMEAHPICWIVYTWRKFIVPFVSNYECNSSKSCRSRENCCCHSI